MLTRRTLLAAGALALLPLPAALPASGADGIPRGPDDRIDWVAYAASLTPAEAHERYLDMVRNCAPEHCKFIETPGPLSDDWFFRSRQAMYRRSCEAI